MNEQIDREPVDRSGWGPGPWDREPDRVEFKTKAGLPALIVRQPRGFLCGYVAVPPGHPLHGKRYSSVAVDGIEVHGGLTYSAACHGKVCHVPKPGEPANVWWFGFDAAHSGDSAPRGGLDYAYGMSFLSMFGGDEPDEGDEDYRTVKYMRRQCEKLAKQLVKAGK